MRVRIVAGFLGILFLMWLAGTILIRIDPEGVAQRSAAAVAPTAMPTRAPTATIWVVSTSRTTSTPTPVPGSVGSEVRIVPNSGAERMPLAVDPQAMDDLSKAAVAKDTVGWNEVIRAGRAFWVDRGARVLVLEQGWETTRVRLLDGPQAGRAGWLISDNLRP